MSVKLLHITENYAKTIEYAARTSTNTETAEEKLFKKAHEIEENLTLEQEFLYGKKAELQAEDFVRKLIEKGHLSVGRHCNASFEVIGSRAMSHQLVRSVMLGVCLSGDTCVTATYSNKKILLKDLFKKSKANVLNKLKIRCVNENTGELIVNKIKDIIYTGKNPVYEIETEHGYKIKATGNHKFYTRDKLWTPLNELNLGQYLHINGVDAYKDKTWLNQKYNIENLSQEKIGILCNVSKHTIRAWVRKFKLQKQMGSWSIGKNPINKGKTKYNYLPLKLLSDKMCSMYKQEEYKKIFSENQKGEKNSNYKKNKGKCRWYNISRENKKKTNKCILCGFEGQTEIHHVDKNIQNPSINNLQELCPQCHRILHKGEGVKVIKLSKIISIKYIGEEDTYDLKMEAPHHNFIANGFVVHNCQESQRYVKFKTSPDTEQYIIPESIQKKGGKVFEDFLDCLETIEAVYDNLISSGIPKEDCRMILPNACKTRLVVSGNFQAISDFCCLRNQIEAQWEIREIAREIFEIMAKEAPAYFEYFRGKDGYCKRKVWE